VSPKRADPAIRIGQDRVDAPFAEAQDNQPPTVAATIGMILIEAPR